MHEDHTHVHEHGHEYCESAHEIQSADENLAMLNYMLEHNRHHGEDLHELYHSLKAAGKTEAAELVGDALHYYDHGNEKLAEALELIKG